MFILAIGLFEYRKFIGNKNREFESKINLDPWYKIKFVLLWKLFVTSGYYHIDNILYIIHNLY